MKQIEIVQIKQVQISVEVEVIFRFPLPAALQNGGVVLPNADKIAQSYGDYRVEPQDVGSPVYCVSTRQTISMGQVNLAQFGATIIGRWTELSTAIAGFVLKPYDTLVGGTFDGTTFTYQTVSSNPTSPITPSNNNPV